MKKFHSFLQRQDGAITVDWVVLAGSCVLLAVFGYNAVEDVLVSFMDLIQAAMGDSGVTT